MSSRSRGPREGVGVGGPNSEDGVGVGGPNSEDGVGVGGPNSEDGVGAGAREKKDAVRNMSMKRRRDQEDVTQGDSCDVHAKAKKQR